MQITKEFIERIDEVLARGLCYGLGSRDGQMCVEAAICYALDEPHGDEPSCVEPAVRRFEVRLNDSSWSSPEARAKGMRSLAIAQLGSKGVVDGVEFLKRVAEKTIRRLIPALFRQLFPNKPDLLAAADRCEIEGSHNAAADAAADAAANVAAYAADAYAANVAAYAAAAYAAAYAADAYAAAYAADAYAASANAADAGEKYLLLSAEIALETLRELGSPGCEWV